MGISDAQEVPTVFLAPYVVDDIVDLRESEELLRAAEQKSRIGDVILYASATLMGVSGLWGALNSGGVKQGVALFGAQLLVFTGSISTSIRVDNQLETAHANHVDNVNYAKFGY